MKKNNIFKSLNILTKNNMMITMMNYINNKYKKKINNIQIYSFFLFNYTYYFQGLPLRTS